MKITVESTTKIVELSTGGRDPMFARIWEGQTDSGIPVHCYVTRIAVAKDEDCPQVEMERFERELQEQRAPSAETEAIPLRMIL